MRFRQDDSLVFMQFLAEYNRDTTAYLHVTEELTGTFDHSFGPDAVGSISLLIDSTRVETCTTHLPATTRNQYYIAKLAA
jgi:hypothetical protein